VSLDRLDGKALFQHTRTNTPQVLWVRSAGRRTQ
jgi:hypothetical protein